MNAETGDEFSARLAKIEAMRARGEDPYPARFDRTHTLHEVRTRWDDKVDEGASTDDVVPRRGPCVAAARSGQARLRDHA